MLRDDHSELSNGHTLRVIKKHFTRHLIPECSILEYSVLDPHVTHLYLCPPRLSHCSRTEARLRTDHIMEAEKRN